jgi:small-conductance mechanosensitive channel
MKTRRTLGFALSLVSVAGVNFIPLEMWLHDDFSGAQSMILYWLENILAIFLAIVFVFLFAPRRDETDKVRTRKDTIVFYSLLAIPFSLASAAFFFYFVVEALASEIDLRAVAQAMLWIVGFLLLEFAADALMIRRLTLFQAELFMNRSLGRIFLFFLTVLLGYCLIIFGFGWFVVPFVVLKTLADIEAQFRILTGYDDLAQKENPLTKDHVPMHEKPNDSKSKRQVASNIYFRKQF